MRSERHATLTAELERLTVERAEAAKRLATARTAAEEVAALTQQLKQAEVVAAAADATLEASVSALTERRRLRADVDERTAAVAELETAAAEAHEEELTAQEVQEAAEAAAEEARASVQASQDRVDAARRAVEQLSDRDEADRLSSRLAKIDAAQSEVEGAERELASIALTDSSMRDIETAAAAVERATGQAELASAHLEVVAVGDIELRVGGEPITLEAGGTWSANATTPTDIDVPGVLIVRVVPGAPASDTQAKLDAAQQVLIAALAAARVDDVAGARVLDQRRRELVSARDKVTATAHGLIGDDDVEALRARLAELRDGEAADAGRRDTAGPTDPGSARVELDAATAAHQRAIADCETHRKVAEAAAKRLGEKVTQAGVAQRS